ncbi:hypothetical protein AO269_21960 [Pseudomonas putida]|nr:hypothetical protein AO269_21960 [Pseudomonas putida]
MIVDVKIDHIANSYTAIGRNAHGDVVFNIILVDTSMGLHCRHNGCVNEGVGGKATMSGVMADVIFAMLGLLNGA